MGLIERFYRGELIPMENIGHSNNPEWEKLNEQVEQLENQLFSILSEEYKELYNEIVAIKLQADFIEITRAFTYGFRMGSKFMIDIFD